MAVCLGLLALPAWSQEWKASAAIPVKLSLLSSKVKPADVQAARKAALTEAWRQYSATLTRARARTLQDKSLNPTEMADRFLSVVQAAESLDKEAGMLTSTVIARVNETALNAFLDSLSVSGTAKSGTGSGFVVMFLQRKAVTSTVVSKRRVAEVKLSRDSSETSSPDGSKFSGSATDLRRETEATERARDEEVFEAVAGAGDLESELAEELSQANFEVMPFNGLPMECEAENAYVAATGEHAQSGNVQRTLSLLLRTIQECEVDTPIRFFALAELDSSAPLYDGATGGQSLGVNLRVRVYAVQGKRVSNIASTRQSFRSNGSDSAEAEARALKLAARKASGVIIDTLQQKGLH